MTDQPAPQDPKIHDAPAEDYVPLDDSIIGRAFRWSIVGIVAIGLIIAGVFYFNRESEDQPVVIDRDPIQPPPTLVQDQTGRPTVSFTDITTQSGITFTHFTGATGDKLLPETMGGGCAFLDYDVDGDQDLLLINGAPWPHIDYDGVAPIQGLYRNDGSGRFEDVTADAGLDVTMYGLGVACGDFDNDGDPDVFISAVGSDRLFRNDDGTFVDVTEDAGVAGDPDGWSSSAGFLDYDNDGDLDLFVCQYIEWSREIDLSLQFTLNGRDRAYGPPTNFRGAFSTLFQNDGAGGFTDVSAEAGIEVRNPSTGEPMGKGLATTFADIDHDGWIDIFVANDTVQNFLFRNRGDGTFEEIGAQAGVAFDQNGQATGAMGVDVGEVENDRRMAIAIGNFATESSSLYVQQGQAIRFTDMANLEGIGSPSRLKLSFGLLFFDYDLDGRLDMLQANGHLEEEINETQSSQHYEQPAQLFWNCGPDARSCFALVPDGAAGDLDRPIVGRGAAFADIDADGDLDVVLTQVGATPLLLRNDGNPAANWIRVKLEGSSANRDAIGAWVEVEAGGLVQRRQVMPTRSYLSQVELPVTFGLGEATTVDRITVTWPDGTIREAGSAASKDTILVKQE